MSEKQISLYSHESKALYVREPNGQYQLATDSQVLSQARIAIDSVLVKSQKCTDSAVVKQFLLGKLSGLSHQVFACLFLDAQLNLIEYKELFNGLVTGTACHVREIAKVALAVNASNVILAHNIPSGFWEVSSADVSFTRHAKKSLNPLGIHLMDHFIVGRRRTYSIASNFSL